MTSLSRTYRTLLPLGGMTLGLGLCALALTHPLHGSARSAKLNHDKPLYLPNGSALDLISFGFKNMLARVLWFQTINYFGKQYANEKNFRWLFHMCDLVTTLDPKALHVFRFGAVMLAWEANAPHLSIELLDKAISHRPNDWIFYYLRGFTYMFFLKENERAREDFLKGARLPEAPPIMARLATRVASDAQNDQEAILLLEDLIRTTPDPTAREALTSRLLELKEKRQ